MGARQFRVEVSREGEAIVVAPHGELDLATVDQLQQELTRAASGAAALILDLRGLTFMDSSGVALVLEQQRTAEAGGTDFRLVRGSDRVQRLFEITGLGPHLRWVEIDPVSESNTAAAGNAARSKSQNGGTQE